MQGTSVKKKLYLSISIIIGLLGIILSVYYRPIVYQNNWNDFGFADTIGSLISVMVFCFFIWGFKEYPTQKKVWQIVIVTFIYAVLWELAGLWGLYGTFDIKDMIAAIVSGILTFLCMIIIERKYDKQINR